MRYYITGVGASFLVRILAMFLAFLVQFYCAWVLGASGYGLYSYALAILSLAVVLVTRGIGPTAVRFVAAASAEEQTDRVWAFWQWGKRRIAMAAALMLPLTLIAGYLLSMVNDTLSLSVFFLLVLGLPFVAFTLFCAGILAGLKRPALSELPESVTKPILLSGVLMIGWMSAPSVGPEVAAVGYLLGSVAAALLGWRLVLRYAGRSVESLAPLAHDEDAVAWTRMARHIFIMALVTLVLDRFDLFLLGWYVDAGSIGIYNVTTRLAQLVGFILLVSNTMMGPLIAQHYQRAEGEELQRLLNFAGRIVTALTLLVLIGVAVAGKWVLSWYGSEFAAGYSALLLLSAGQFMNAAFGPVGLMLNMTGRTSAALRIVTVSSVICVLLNLVLVPLYGIEGAAVSTATGMVAWNLWMYLQVRRDMGYDPSGLRRCADGNLP